MELYLMLFILGVVMFIIEIFTPAFVAGSIGIGFFFSGFAAWCNLSVTWQIIFGIIGMVLTIIFLRPIINRYTQKGEEKIRTNQNAMIGRSAKVFESTDDGGKVRLDGTIWKVRTRDNASIPVDTQVEIVALESIELIVTIK